MNTEEIVDYICTTFADEKNETSILIPEIIRCNLQDALEIKSGKLQRILLFVVCNDFRKRISKDN